MDKERVPKNTYTVFSTLSLIGERCKVIPSVERQLSFFQQVQLHMLVEYVEDVRFGIVSRKAGS